VPISPHAAPAYNDSEVHLNATSVERMPDARSRRGSHYRECDAFSGTGASPEARCAVE
jgi:hypothetical protein